MISNINTTKRLIQKYNIRIKKDYGQNFLIDESILDKIISSACLDKETGVIEIGPGLGSLTERILNHAKRVLAFEIDPQMVRVLNDSFADCDTLQIVTEDFLKIDLENHMEFFNDCNNVIVISNLPYYITTPILFKLLETDLNINNYYLMVQKEVAQRFTGRPQTKDYNALSVIIEYKTNSKVLFSVGKNCFFPVPLVESAVIHVERVKKDYGVNNEVNFLKFVQVIFNQRRKTLTNNICAGYNLSKEKWIAFLGENGYNINIRAESMALEEIAEMYKNFFE